jgi:hypothetical protein
MAKYSQGIFIPKNPKKILGKSKIEFRSSWELRVMQFLDQSPNVIQWSSESIAIPYRDPVSGKNRQYIPDLLILFKDKNNKQKLELVEIKPHKESLMENAKSKRDKLAVLTNTAKWAAAMAWCAKNGVTFRILTEHDIFITGK